MLLTAWTMTFKWRVSLIWIWTFPRSTLFLLKHSSSICSFVSEACHESIEPNGSWMVALNVFVYCFFLCNGWPGRFTVGFMEGSVVCAIIPKTPTSKPWLSITIETSHNDGRWPSHIPGWSDQMAVEEDARLEIQKTP